MKISQNDEEIQGSLQKEPPQLSNNLKYPNVRKCFFYRNGNVAAANAFLWTFCVMAGLIARMVLMKQSQVFVACPWKSDWQRGTMQHRAELKSGKSKTQSKPAAQNYCKITLATEVLHRKWLILNAD